MSKAPHVLVVEARFYEDMANELFRGAELALKAAGATYDRVSVPGALEIPAAIAFAEEGAHRPAGAVAYDGYVALGAVIRGETYHFEIVSNESARGIMDLAIGKRLAIGNGILTVEDEAQALVRARISESDKGGGAARAALEMVSLKQQLLGQKR